MSTLGLLIERAMRTVLRIAFLLLALGLAIGVLAAGLAALLVASVWALLRGRRPPVVTVYRFSQQVWARGQAAWRPMAGAAGRRGAPWGGAGAAEVVDVEVREVGAANPQGRLDR